MKQTVSNPPLKWWQGIAAILLLIVLLSAAQFASALVSYMLGGGTAYTVASIAYWIFGGVVAVTFVRTFIMKYAYSLEGLSFNIDRVYGRLKPRNAVSIVTRKIIDIGTIDEIAERYPDIQHYTSYTKKRAALETKSLVYDAGNGYKMIRFQPNDELYERLAQWVDENSLSNKHQSKFHSDRRSPDTKNAL